MSEPLIKSIGPYNIRRGVIAHVENIDDDMYYAYGTIHRGEEMFRWRVSDGRVSAYGELADDIVSSAVSETSDLLRDAMRPFNEAKAKRDRQEELERNKITDLQQQLLERAHVIAKDTERIRQLEHVCRLMAKTLRNYPEHAWIVEEFEKVVGE